MPNKTADPSIRPFLVPNAIVKWDEWREWTDLESNVPHAEYQIRFTVVPDAFIGCTAPEDSAFLTCTVADGLREGPAFMFTFMTYLMQVSGADHIDELRRLIACGNAELTYCREAQRPTLRTPSGIDVCAFPVIVAGMAAWANAHYRVVLRGASYSTEDIFREMVSRA